MLAQERPYSRRTRRRQQTHQNILQAAHRLFAERGYEHTKLIDIADAADLHLQTLYRHFNCKHELAAAIDREFLKAFQANIVDREQDTLAFWRAWVEDASKNMLELGVDYRKTLLNLFSVPAMSTTFLETWFEYQDTLATEISKDWGTAPNASASAQVLAGALVTANTQVIRRWLHADGKFDLVAEACGTADLVATEFGPALKKNVKKERRAKS